MTDGACALYESPGFGLRDGPRVRARTGYSYVN
jgi:hypothetical protein